MEQSRASRFVQVEQLDFCRERARSGFDWTLRRKESWIFMEWCELRTIPCPQKVVTRQLLRLRSTLLLTPDQKLGVHFIHGWRMLRRNSKQAAHLQTWKAESLSQLMQAELNKASYPTCSSCGLLAAKPCFPALLLPGSVPVVFFFVSPWLFPFLDPFSPRKFLLADEMLRSVPVQQPIQVYIPCCGLASSWRGTE